jgi:hypothetical protein
VVGVRSRQIKNGGKSCRWDGVVLQLPPMVVQLVTGKDLLVEVWNQNLPPLQADTLIGRAALHLSAGRLAKALDRPAGGLPLELQLSQNRKDQGVITLVVTAEVVEEVKPATATVAPAPAPAPAVSEPGVVIVRVARLEAANLRDVEWGLGKLVGSKLDPFVKLRLGQQEHTTKTVRLPLASHLPLGRSRLDE